MKEEILKIVAMQVSIYFLAFLAAKFFNKREEKERERMIRQGRETIEEIYKTEFLEKFEKLEIGKYYKFNLEENVLTGELIRREREGYVSKVLATGNFNWNVGPGFDSIHNEIEMNIHGVRLPIRGHITWLEQVKIINMITEVETPKEELLDEIRLNKFNSFFGKEN